MSPSIPKFIAIFLVGFVILVAGISGGVILWNSRQATKIPQEVQRPLQRTISFDKFATFQNANCTPVKANSVASGSDLNAKLAGGIVFYSNSSSDKKTICVFARRVADGKEKLISAEQIETTYQPISFALAPSGNVLFYVLTLQGLNSAVLRAQDLQTGKEQTILTYVDTPQDQVAHEIDTSNDIIQDDGPDGIVSADLQVVNGYLIERLGFDLTKVDEYGNFVQAGIGFGSTQETFIFKFNNEKSPPVFIKKSSSIVPGRILSIINDTLYIDQWVYEGNDDIKAYPLTKGEDYSLSKKFGFGNWGGVVSPDSKYFAFSPLVLIDKSKREYDETNLRNQVALLDFQKEQFIPINIVAAGCPAGSDCFSSIVWVDDRSFIIQEEKNKIPVGYYLVFIDGTFKVLSKTEYESLRDRISGFFRQQYENLVLPYTSASVIGWLRDT